jgi:hypothetical protein
MRVPVLKNKKEHYENSRQKSNIELRKVSALVSPTGKETIVPMQLFACIKCGHVNEDMYPIE